MEENKTFKDAMQRLEMIIEKLEKNEIELEEAISLFEEGLKLVEMCDEQLKTFENKVNQLIHDNQKDNETK